MIVTGRRLQAGNQKKIKKNPLIQDLWMKPKKKKNPLIQDLWMRGAFNNPEEPKPNAEVHFSRG